MKINYSVDYKGHQYIVWNIKNYLVSLNRGIWFCSCSIKYKRNPSIECKHIILCKNFLCDSLLIQDKITKEIYGISKKKDSLRAKFEVWQQIQDNIIVDFEEFAHRTISQ